MDFWLHYCEQIVDCGKFFDYPREKLLAKPSSIQLKQLNTDGSLVSGSLSCFLKGCIGAKNLGNSLGLELNLKDSFIISFIYVCLSRFLG